MKTERLVIDAFDESIAAHQKGPQQFLEGLDVKDNSFECWLRDMRQKIAEGLLDKSSGVQSRIAPRRITLGLLPAIAGDRIGKRSLADDVLDRLVVALGHTGFFDIFDYRDRAHTSPTPCDLSLAIRPFRQDSSEQMTIIVRRPRDNAMLWGRSASVSHTASDLSLRCLVAEATEQMCQTILQPCIATSSAGRLAMDGVDHMFRRCGDNLAKSEALLREAIDCEPKGIYIAWYAYLSAFRLESTKGKDIAELREHSDALARRALELDPWNPVSRSLVAHVYGFIFRDFAKASALLEPALTQPVDSAIFHHNTAMLNFYVGKYTEAKAHASLACAMGHGHPFRYAFSTSMSMINLMNGDLDSAIRFGELARGDSSQGRETYSPTLRYLAASYASKGDHESATEVISGLGENGVQRFLHALEDPGYPVPSIAARRQLRSSLKELAPL